jgi:aryl-alcohol dehydrogenase-like predicted oxidoreductase
MQYRTLGKSGIKVSEIGVGGHQTMELASALDPDHAATWRTHFNGQIPSMPDADRAVIIARALDLGVNYFDTSLDPETESLGKALKLLGRRDECVVTVVAGVMQYMMPDTNAYWAKKAVAQDIDRGLDLLGYDHIDVCIVCMCNIRYGHDMIEGALEAMSEAKQAGKIRAAGFSDHQNGVFAADVVEKYHHALDMVMYPLNFGRRIALTKILPLTRKHDLGFVAMKPLERGDVLVDPELLRYAESQSLSAASAAYRWIMQHDGVSVALGAVNRISEIEKNCGGVV